MRVLLDTHAFLWLAAGDERASDRCVEVFLDPANDCVLSVASVWEMAIKVSLGRLRLGRPLDRLVRAATEEQGVRLLPVERDHAIHVASLPFHHRDPFDRLLVAQALVEGLPVVGRGEAFDAYGVRRIW